MNMSATTQSFSTSRAFPQSTPNVSAASSAQPFRLSNITKALVVGLLGLQGGAGAHMKGLRSVPANRAMTTVDFLDAGKGKGFSTKGMGAVKGMGTGKDVGAGNGVGSGTISGGGCYGSGIYGCGDVGEFPTTSPSVATTSAPSFQSATPMPAVEATDPGEGNGSSGHVNGMGYGCYGGSGSYGCDGGGKSGITPPSANPTSIPSVQSKTTTPTLEKTNSGERGEGTHQVNNNKITGLTAAMFVAEAVGAIGLVVVGVVLGRRLERANFAAQQAEARGNQ